MPLLKEWAVAQVAILERQVALADIASSWVMIAGDASFRRYFRLTADKHSYIVMDAPPEHEDAATFVAVAHKIRAANLRVPSIYAQDLEAGFLLIEDFGDCMLKQHLSNTPGQSLFEQILPLLEGMSRVGTQGLPVLDGASLRSELDLFTNWFLQRHCRHTLAVDERVLWDSLCDLLVEVASSQPQCFVHRDFHSCNLQVLNNGELGIIDFQDAVLGPASYDLASWLWDRYVSWSREEIEQWVEQARPSLAPQLQSEQWLRYCDLMGLQRNLKIIGIFSRLYYRDEKSGYLELLPQFSGYVRDVMSRYAELQPQRAQVIKWLELCPK